MLDPDQFDHVIHVFEHIVDGDFAFADTLWKRQDPDQTALICNRLDLIVGEIAWVIEHAAGVRVADDQRRSGGVERLKKSFPVHVREIYNHAQAVRFFKDLNAEIRQSSAGAVFPDAVAKLVAKIPDGLERT